MSLQDDLKYCLNHPETGNWQNIVKPDPPQALETTLNLVGDALSKGKKLPVKTRLLGEVVDGKFGIEDMDVLLILRSYQ